jgi:isopentenyl diphosphate isomerase/L-lactate dehydrogenase-like FMN-dependent dehydrogenase
VETRPLTLSDVESEALERLDPDWAGYFAGGAEDERTLEVNRAAFDAWSLRQRILTGAIEPSTTLTVLGQQLAHPIVVAPVAYQRMAHPEGEEGMAAAAAATGGALCLSTFSIPSAAEVAAAAPGGVRFLQLYVFRDRGVSDELVAQAVELGYSAVVLTADLPVLGPRDRERRVHWTFPEDAIAAVRYAIERGVTGAGLELLDPTLDWAYLEHLASTAGVPVVVKGVMEPEDALRCADHGAAGVVVSNHGGRQLDRTPATIEVLPEIAEALAGRAEVWVDGGIRRGTDVLTALALGARVVLAGRQPIWGLAARGTEGARETIELMWEELRVAMHLTGCRSLDEIGPHVLRRRRP